MRSLARDSASVAPCTSSVTVTTNSGEGSHSPGATNRSDAIRTDMGTCLGSARVLLLDLPVPEARADVVVHEAARLHEGVTDRRADEPEPAALQVLRHRPRLLG